MQMDASVVEKLHVAWIENNALDLNNVDSAASFGEVSRINLKRNSFPMYLTPATEYRRTDGTNAGMTNQGEMTKIEVVIIVPSIPDGYVDQDFEPFSEAGRVVRASFTGIMEQVFDRKDSTRQRVVVNLCYGSFTSFFQVISCNLLFRRHDQTSPFRWSAVCNMAFHVLMAVVEYLKQLQRTQIDIISDVHAHTCCRVLIMPPAVVGASRVASRGYADARRFNADAAVERPSAKCYFPSPRSDADLCQDGSYGIAANISHRLHKTKKLSLKLLIATANV